MSKAEIILISGKYAVLSDSQKLAENLAILWLLQQLDQKRPKLYLQDRHSIAIVIWIGKSKKAWKQLKRKAARAGIAIARPKGWRRWLLVSSSPELFKNQPPTDSPGKSRKNWQTGGDLGVSGELPLTRCECITLAYLAIREEARM